MSNEEKINFQIISENELLQKVQENITSVKFLVLPEMVIEVRCKSEGQGFNNAIYELRKVEEKVDVVIGTTQYVTQITAMQFCDYSDYSSGVGFHTTVWIEFKVRQDVVFNHYEARR
jgi:hypothetical protein